MKPLTPRLNLSEVVRVLLVAGCATLSVSPSKILAQAAAAASAPARATPQRGTVKAIDGNNLTLATDNGQLLLVSVPPTARVQRLAAGSTDLKTAESAAITDVAVGDRVLVTGSSGDAPGTFSASRVILMKSSDIAQRHEAEQQDWQRRGMGGIVNAVDAASGDISVSSGARKLQVTTTKSTSFRRYADGSVKFEDAKPGALADIHTGDQLLARGAKSEDGTSLAAEEVVSGSFKNLSGTVVAVDGAANTVQLKDLVSKHNVTVHLTANSAIHRLPADAATRLAARAHASSTGVSAPAAGNTAAARPAHDASGEERHPEGQGRSGAGDLSQVVARLPAMPLAELHAGDAVMVVAEQSSSDTANLTAITLLAGVESILAASPSGASAMTLSPWSVGSGSPEGGGSQ